MAKVARGFSIRFWLWLIRGIGVIVPQRLRADWRQEWEAELHWREAMLAEWDKLNWQNKLELFCRSLGAFWDALWLQRERWEDEMFQDIRFGMRMLLKHKGFTVVAVLTLALGIGATTALFSVIYGVLISPYPYAKPGEIWTPGLVSVKSNQTMRPYPPSAVAEMAKMPVFSDVMATGPGNMLLTGEYAPETIGAIRLSGNAFNFLGVPPLLGRTIQPSDIRPNGEPEPVTVLSFKRWQRMGGDPKVLGKTIRLNEESYTVIGVMPPRFGWWTDNGVWLPMGINARDTQMIFPIVRLKPGMTATTATQQLHTLHLEVAKNPQARFPNEDFTSKLTNYLDITVASGEMKRSLQLLFGAVAFLLLIACANVANLQLAKATGRAREMSIRMALGAGRGKLVRQLLTESVLLSAMGGLLGLLFAYWITQLMVTLMPSDFVPNESRIEVNRYVLFFCFGVSILTGILFGLVPALQSSRFNLVEKLKDESRGSSAASGGKVRAALVVVEVALAVVLLVSASLTIRSFLALQKVELGFQPEHVLGAGIPLPPKRYSTWEQRNRFAHDLLERVRNVPGVVAATIGNGGLPFGGPDTAYAIDGQPNLEARGISMVLAGADYLRTLSIPLRQGRMLTEQEVNTGERLAVINEAAVKLWPAGENPIGHRIRLNELEKPSRPNLLTSAGASPDVTIIGIMGNVQNDDVRNEPQPAVLVPYTLLAPPGRTLAIRAQGDPLALVNALRAQVQALDSQQPISNPITFEELMGFRTAQPRFTMALFSLFAALGLALALAGIYSVLSYLVSMRTREIGVRMALGAQSSDIHRLIFRMGGKLVCAGLCVGLIASVAMARLLGSQLDLFRVSATDPISLLSVIMLLGLVAAAACFLPARRATKVDPNEALRYD
ncbi:MAG: ABC transporter permease [Acidobacteria bacterium]|nr:ABC transporter permease [Acidobacteriota bacterium]